MGSKKATQLKSGMAYFPFYRKDRMSQIDPYLLIVAMEEAGEFAQACSKVYRHNGGKIELKCLSEEVGDLQAMINLLTEAGYVDLKRAEKKRINREKKHRKYDENKCRGISPHQKIRRV